MKLTILAALAAVVLAPQANARGHYSGPRSGSHYENVDHHSIHSPMRSSHRPYGASAHCGDGTWSFSQHARGTCSHHGGVE
jgi:hypothetical protein